MTVMLVFVLEFVESFVFCWGVVQQLREQDKGDSTLDLFAPDPFKIMLLKGESLWKL